jgi:hypothetical protein
MWLGLTAMVLAASIGFTVLAIAVQRFPPPSGSRPLALAQAWRDLASRKAAYSPSAISRYENPAARGHAAAGSRRPQG